jgi:hypothetical protein
MPAPPLEVVEVPGVVGFVAVVVLVLVLVDVDDEVVVVLGVLVVLLLVVVGVELLEVRVVDVLVVVEQSCAASWLTVPAPWLRFLTSVVLIEEGRLVTALVSAAAALCATPHWPAATAEEMESSWLARLLL